MAKSERLDEIISVPVTKSLKRKVIAMAQTFPGNPKPSAYARLLLEDGLKRAEHGQQPGQPGEVEMASSSR